MAFGLALAGLGALGKLGTGIFQGIKANSLDKASIRPQQVVQNEYYQNVNDADQMARRGLPQEQYNLAQQNLQRNQASSLNALSRSSNPGAGLAGMLRASNDASLGLDVQNAQARQQGIKYLAQQRGALAQQKNNAFDWNNKSKYLAEQARIQALRGAGAQNMTGAFGDVAQAGMLSQMGGGSSTGGANMLSQLGNTPDRKSVV